MISLQATYGIEQIRFYGRDHIMFELLFWQRLLCAALFVSMMLIVIGTGLLKSMCQGWSVIYSKEDVRRDAGFSIFYMGISNGEEMAPVRRP